MGWATFWATFSRTHPVTLVSTVAYVYQNRIPRQEEVLLRCLEWVLCANLGYNLKN
jgi:hypothetical protein